MLIILFYTTFQHYISVFGTPDLFVHEIEASASLECLDSLPNMIIFETSFWSINISMPLVCRCLGNGGRSKNIQKESRKN